MFILVQTFYNRVNFLADRLALVRDLRYNLAMNTMVVLGSIMDISLAL